MSKFILVKAIEALKTLKYMDQSFEDPQKEYDFYITNSKDRQIIKDLDGEEYPFYVLVFKDKAQTIVQCIYLGSGRKHIDGQNVSVKYKILQKVMNKTIINNFLSCSEIDLDKDFDDFSYATIENSPSLVKQMNFIAYPPYKNNDVLKKAEYCAIDEEKGLHPLAQRNQYCNRDYFHASKERDRSEFQRDYERIVHSKAFRRMVDKAQIFSAKKGDHYRTRMTHSIVVSQIAKALSRALSLNAFLTDSIALGHDMGHTPFGHQGERTINAILKGEKPLLENAIKKGAVYGGFKHNYHSLRVATRLEEKYIEFEGINLSYQTLDGIWKHTKTNLTDDSLARFVSSKELRSYLMANSDPCTLEGQVVRVADEIAQRSHDLEDAFSAKRLSVGELKNYLLLGKMQGLNTEIEEIETAFEAAKKSNRFGADDDELLQERISSRIIHFFIKDVVIKTKENIENFMGDGGKERFDQNNHCISVPLVDFSADGKQLCDYLEKIISKKVINSAEVSLFDSNGATIIASLFESYYYNPRLLHRGTLHRIMQDFRKLTKNVIDFEEGDPRIIEKEWRKIINAEADVDDIDLVDNEYIRKNEILVKNITDFIAGMTDSYALNEYNSIRR